MVVKVSKKNGSIKCGVGSWFTSAEKGTVYILRNGKVVWSTEGKDDSEFYDYGDYIVLLGKDGFFRGDYDLAVYEAKEPLKLVDPSEIPGLIDFLDAVVISVKLVEPVGVWLHTPYSVEEYSDYKRVKREE